MCLNGESWRSERWHFYRGNYRDIIPVGKEVRLLRQLLQIMVPLYGTLTLSRTDGRYMHGAHMPPAARNPS